MDNKKEKTKKLGERFAKNLASYSVMAAGASILCVPHAYAKARCNYAPDEGIVIAPPEDPGVNMVPLDIDGDGNIDFKFFAYNYYKTMRFNYMSLINAENRVVSSINKLLRRLPVNAVINASASTWDLINNKLAATWSENWSTTYNWYNNQTGYIGVKFKIGSGMHEGWIKYQQTAGTGIEFKGYIQAWGYETDANTDLLTGQNCSGPTLVELAAFTAKGGARGVGLAWETASEIDNAGFHVWRSEKEQWGYERITETLIPAEGGATQGAAYSFEDADAAPGKTWFYRLADVDTGGNTTLHGPVSAWTGMVNIQVNGADGPATISPSEAVSVVVKAQAQDDAAAPREWWICCDAPFGWFSYVQQGGWVPGIKPCTVSPEQSAEGVKVFDQTLPAGIYNFYFALDGILDGQPRPDWLDSVEVTVGE